jgi:hypothetical protein
LQVCEIIALQYIWQPNIHPQVTRPRPIWQSRNPKYICWSRKTNQVLDEISAFLATFGLSRHLQRAMTQGVNKLVNLELEVEKGRLPCLIATHRYATQFGNIADEFPSSIDVV